jgi:hypothetical protein
MGLKGQKNTVNCRAFWVNWRPMIYSFGVTSVLFLTFCLGTSYCLTLSTILGLRSSVILQRCCRSGMLRVSYRSFGWSYYFSLQFRTLRVKALRSLKISMTIYKSPRCNVRKDISLEHWLSYVALHHVLTLCETVCINGSYVILTVKVPHASKWN